jgi:2-octaprenyl-6-methoxyphenol hydroxylase
MPAQRRIVIGGGAFAGLALALALRQGLGADIPVIVADPALAARPSHDPRATAIVAACRRLFQAIGVWDLVAAEAQPILDMVVTDSRLEDATRPVFLTFAGDVEPGEPFAHMIENRHLIDALVGRAQAEGIDLRASAVTMFESSSQGVDVTLADGSMIEASLLVAADGARSKLRERAGIATHGWDYDQSGIVVTVGHERDHHGRAEEHFARRWYGPSSAPKPPASPHSARMNSTANSNGASVCISARSSRWTDRAPFRSDISSRARSSGSGWR